jgi:hypothetical protein
MPEDMRKKANLRKTPISLVFATIISFLLLSGLAIG